MLDFIHNENNLGDSSDVSYMMLDVPPHIFILDWGKSFEQRHPLGLGIPAAAGDEVKVYAAGHSGARDVVPGTPCLINDLQYVRDLFLQITYHI